MDEVSKLEELFKNGFIIEDEYKTRKDAAIAGIGYESAKKSQKSTISQDIVIDVQEIHEIMRIIIMPPSVPELLEKLVQIRKLLSLTRNAPIDEVIKCNILPTLKTFLTDPNCPTSIAGESLWIVTNIASGTSENSKKILEAGFLPIVIQYLMVNDMYICEQAIWALGNIAGESVENRNLVLSQNVIPIMVQLSNNFYFPLSTFRCLTWVLSNLCRGKPAPPFHVVEPLVAVFAKLLQAKDNKIQTDALWGFTFLSDSDGINSIIDSGVLSCVVDYLGSTEIQLMTPALRTVGNIVTGNDIQTQVMLNYNILGYISKLVKSTRKGIAKESLWIISNILAGTSSQIQAVFDAGIIEYITQLILTTNETEIKREAIHAISNATCGATTKQLYKLIMEFPSIQCLISVLGFNSDVKTLCASLKEILTETMKDFCDDIIRYNNFDMDGPLHPYEEIMKRFFLKDSLVPLSSHPNDEIASDATFMLTLLHN